MSVYPGVDSGGLLRNAPPAKLRLGFDPLSMDTQPDRKRSQVSVWARRFAWRRAFSPLPQFQERRIAQWFSQQISATAGLRV